MKTSYPQILRDLAYQAKMSGSDSTQSLLLNAAIVMDQAETALETARVATQALSRSLDRRDAMERALRSVFDKITHGNDPHRAWLRQKCNMILLEAGLKP